MSGRAAAAIGPTRTVEFDADTLGAERTRLVLSLDQRLERFCRSQPLSELNVVFHSTGVNYAHQFYVLSMLGRDRLSQFKSVNFVSGSVIAAIVYYSAKTGNLEYRRGDALLWERRFFEAHGLSPLKSTLRVPYRLMRGVPILSRQVQMDVIRDGIGKDFGERTVSFFPNNFRFWLFDATRGALRCATADNDLNFLKLVELAVAATAVPRLFHPLEIGNFRFIDPVFSAGRRQLAAQLRKTTGPTLVSNMVLDRDATPRDFIRPHFHASGRLLMLRELLQFFLGLSNRDHVEGLEGGLGELGSRID
jgi:hypothetical protein